MDKKTIKFDDTENEEYKFLQNKIPISINDMDINEIVVSDKLPVGKQKYLISYKDDQKNKLLCICFTNGYI